MAKVSLGVSKFSTSGRLLLVQWGHGEALEQRQKLLQGRLQVWEAVQLEPGVYKLSASLDLDEIERSLARCLRQDDQAFLFNGLRSGRLAVRGYNHAF